MRRRKIMSDVSPQPVPDEPIVTSPAVEEVAPEPAVETADLPSDSSDISGETTFTEDAPDNTDSQTEKEL
jgi:hypothetical protein